MDPIEILGFVGGAFLITAMIVRKAYMVKALMLVTAICYLVYGIVLDLLPLIVLNIILVTTGIYELILLARKRGEAVKAN